MYCNTSLASFSLSLSGRRWHIRAGDPEISPVVHALGKTISLPSETIPAQQQVTEEWHSELCVVTDSCQSSSLTGNTESDHYFCFLPLPRNNDRIVFGMSLIALAIARAELSRGGLLIHGALATTPDDIGGGVILAGGSEVGKTTASNRLPLPWHSLSDDATLILRDSSGRYIAHPWPTWSRLFQTRQGKDIPAEHWDTQNGVPLRALYFLKQDQEDKASLLPSVSAVTYLMDTVQLVSSLMTLRLSHNQVQTLYDEQLAAAETLVRTLPSYTLRLSLTGTFWKNIKETLASDSDTFVTPPVPSPLAKNNIQKHRNKPETFLFKNTPLFATCYSGSSMNPVLRHSDLLEVLPYGKQPVRRGDIVYFLSPIDEQKIIHRVVRITDKGIQTRGDNNPAVDSYCLQKKDILGKVIAAWRKNQRRKIAGGFYGTSQGFVGILWCQLNTFSSPLLHKLYNGLALSNICRHLLPSTFQPKVVKFQHTYQSAILKLVVKGKIVGHYDDYQEQWVINRPWKLAVDQSKLPTVTKELSSSQTKNKSNSVTSNKTALS